MKAHPMPTFMFKGTQTTHEGPKRREETNGLLI